MHLVGVHILLFQTWILIFGLEVVSSDKSNHSPTEKAKVQESPPSDIDSGDIYQTFNFQPEYMPRQHFWESTDFDFESRYKREQTCSRKTSSCHPPPLEVFVVPFSHTDPFWLHTFETYFEYDTKAILDNIVEKLSQYNDMTFVWSEISFLARWWETTANATQKAKFIKLLNEGRLEIITGGWVMPDEACPSLFALSQQLIEGREWVRNNLKYKPITAWSIDPFGQGSVMPYLLKESGIKGMMIGRIHYGWKHWLSEHKYVDFLWNQRFDDLGEHKIHCLSHPNVHYSMSDACGPMKAVCDKLANFRYDDYDASNLVVNVSQKSIQMMADDLIGQYRRTASLTRHNVVVTIVGDDFKFSQISDLDSQYLNKNALFKFINSHPERYNAKVGFGTLSQYFKAVEKKKVALPNFKGDFFPYGDIQFLYPPSYWTGYYSTRPFFKRLSRKTENELRKAEVLFTYTFNYVKQHEAKNTSELEQLTKSFESLVQARQLLALFQHHDGISGTSPRYTMVDVMGKLNTALRFSEDIQKICVKILVGRELVMQTSAKNLESTFVNLGEPELEERIPLKFKPDVSVKKMVFFNGLGWTKSHLVRVLVDSPNMMVKGSVKGKATVISQINRHYFKLGKEGKTDLFSGYYELVFIAELAPFGITTYEVERFSPNSSPRSAPFTFAVEGTFKCNTCKVKGIQPLDGSPITLENKKLKATFDGGSGLLKNILLKTDKISTKVEMSYGKYKPDRGSGAYLSRPLTNDTVNILAKCKNGKGPKVFVISGPVLQEVRIICERFTTSYQILQEGTSEALSALHVTNRIQPISAEYYFDNTDGEYFMRFQTDLATKTKIANSSLEEPTFFTDNGLGVEKRRKVSRLPYQGNLYPVVNYAWIHDSTTGRRLSVLVDRSHGFMTNVSGHLEAIIDRRVPMDDNRGMREGITDPEHMVSNYVILLESTPAIQKDTDAWKPSLAVQRTSKFLNYGPSVFIYDDLRRSQNPQISLFTKQFPEDVFLLNFRTSSSIATPHSGPGKSALMLLQNLGHLEQIGKNPSQSLFGSDLAIDHYCTPTNLVGDPILNGSISHGQSSTTTGKLNVSKPFEVSAFAVHFEKSLNVLI